MKSLINGLGSGFGRAFGRIIAYILIAFIAVLFLQKNNVNVIDYINPLKLLGFEVSAASVTPYQYLNGCNSGRYNIFKADENETITYAQTGYSYNIPWKAISFTGSASLSANTYYDLTINFMSNPTNFGFTSNSTHVGSISSICGTEQDSYSVSSLNITSSKVVVRFLTGSTSRSYFYITLTSENTPTMSNGISSITINSVDLSGSSGIINNNNENTNNIINNNNQNTQDVIDNQTQNTQDILDSQQDINDSLNTNCKNGPLVVNQEDFTLDNENYLNSSGELIYNRSYSVSKWFIIQPSTQYKIDFSSTSSTPYFCWYRSDKVLISCQNYSSSSITLTTPSNALYFRFSLGGGRNITITGPVCNDWTSESINDLTDSQNDTNDLLTDDDIDDDLGSSFFDDFENNDFGLSDIITIPLTTIQSLTSKSCVALSVPIPFTNSNIQLPCMTSIYQSKLPSIYNLWKIVSFGIISYYIAVDIFHLVKGFKDPESDKVEVLDL